MKFVLRKASDWKFEKVIEIDTLEDLKKLSQEYQEQIIVDFTSFANTVKNKGGEEIFPLLIYDDYLE